MEENIIEHQTKNYVDDAMKYLVLNNKLDNLAISNKMHESDEMLKQYTNLEGIYI